VLELCSLGTGSLSDPKIHAPPHMLPRRTWALNGVVRDRGNPQNLGAMGLHPSGMGHSRSPQTSPLPICVTTSNLVVLQQRVVKRSKI